MGAGGLLGPACSSSESSNVPVVSRLFLVPRRLLIFTLTFHRSHDLRCREHLLQKIHFIFFVPSLQESNFLQNSVVLCLPQVSLPISGLLHDPPPPLVQLPYTNRLMSASRVERGARAARRALRVDRIGARSRDAVHRLARAHDYCKHARYRRM